MATPLMITLLPQMSDNGLISYVTSFLPAGIVQLVEQQTVMLQVPGSIPTQPDWGFTQPSIPLWIGKMSTSKNIG